MYVYGVLLLKFFFIPNTVHREGKCHGRFIRGFLDAARGDWFRSSVPTLCPRTLGTQNMRVQILSQSVLSILYLR